MARGGPRARCDVHFVRTTTAMWVRPNDVDALGHVNHATVLEYFENARLDWLATNGLALSPTCAAVVARAVIDYRWPITCRRVEVDTSTAPLADAAELAYRVDFLQAVRCVGDGAGAGKVAVEARIEVGFIDPRDGSLKSVQAFLGSQGRSP